MNIYEAIEQHHHLAGITPELILSYLKPYKALALPKVGGSGLALSTTDAAVILAQLGDVTGTIAFTRMNEFHTVTSDLVAAIKLITIPTESTKKLRLCFTNAEVVL